jgi:putative ABC transport system permease protein
MAILDSLRQDIRYAVRTLGKNLFFAVAALLTLSLGVAGSTTMFTVIRSVLLKPLAYTDPDRLLRISGGATIVRYEELKASASSFGEIGAFLVTFPNVSLSGKEGPEVVKVTRVTGNFLGLLGVEPVAGRGFQNSDEAAGSAPVAMISSELWRRSLGGNASIVGQPITLNGVVYIVVGILPSGFSFPAPGLDVWLTPPMPPSANLPAAALNSPVLSMFARLAPRVTIEQANTQFRVFNQRYAAEHPGMLDAKPASPSTLVPMKDQLVANVRPMLWMLFGAAGLVLMIGCANVAGLMLARAAAREREFAVRTSLGASRGRIVCQLLVESLVLAIVAGAVGLLLARFAVTAIANLTSFNLPRAGEIRLDVIVTLFGATISIATGLMFGLVPAFSASTTAAASMKVRNPRRITRWLNTRGLLVAGQVALSVILLIGATLLMKSIARLQNVDAGFNPENVVTLQIGLSAARYNTDQKRRLFFDELIQRVHGLPGVQNAAVLTTLPMTPWVGRPVQVSGRPVQKLNERAQAVQQSITPEYFRTLQIPLRRGREFTSADSWNTPLVVIINESLARLLWTGYPNAQDPIGQRLLLGIDPRPFEIVGVVADSRQAALEREPQPGIFLVYGQSPSSSTEAFTIRTNGEIGQLMGSLRDVVRAIDPNQAITGVRPLANIIEDTLGQRRLLMTLLQLFAGVAVTLALVGIYGMIAYSVVQRTREVGVRMALGAHPFHILRLLLQRGLGTTVLGVSSGLVGALALTRTLKAFLFEISAADPMTYATVAALFLIVSAGASYLPLRRVGRIDPMTVLRHD